MKAQEFIKEVDNSDRGMNKYGLAARNKDGKFYSYRHGKLTGTFNNIQDLQRHQHELIKDESVSEDAGLTDQQKQGLQAIYKKYGNYEGYGNGDSLPIGNMEQVIDPGSTLWADDKEYKELDAYMKKMGYDGFSDAQDKDEDFFDNAMKEMPISSAMQDDISKVLGNDYYEKPNLARAAKDYMSSSDESVSEDEGELARLKELSGIEEGADFYGYYKDPKDPEGKTFTYPNNMEFKTPHRSNANARMLLSRIGLEPDFENTGSHLIDDFIKVTTNWLQTHEADKDTNEYDEVEMYHVEANRIKKTHPEVTHVGFN